MNKYLQKLLYGKREHNLIVENALGIPNVLAVLDPEASNQPHIAIVDGVLYLWNVAAQEWNSYSLISNEIISLETATDITYTLPDGHMIDMIVLKSENADTVNITTTPGGLLTPAGIPLIANQFKSQIIQIIADGTDVDVDFTGFTGASIIKIYKRKLIN